jgi:hypothetical protein
MIEFEAQSAPLRAAILGFQQEIREPLPVIKGNKDYRDMEDLLCRMDALLAQSDIERDYVTGIVNQWVEEHPDHRFGQSAANRMVRQGRRMMRCTIARLLSGESYRAFAKHLAESALLRWFCLYDQLGDVRPPSKSTLKRMEADTPTPLLQAVHRHLIQASAANDPATGHSSIGLADPIDLSTIWMDTTCAQLDIHFPTDWRQVCDGIRSIMTTITTIRAHGLRHRMPDPHQLQSAVNRLSIAMSQASRRGRGGDKRHERKRTLRKLKRLGKKALGHASRYARLLEQRHAEVTDLSPAQADRLIERLDHLVELLPVVMKQAHERIIGGRQIPNDAKILSLYQPHARVYVRGKAGADTEFGLQLLLAETREGLIVDCQLTPDGIASDVDLLLPAVDRMRDHLGPASCQRIVTDRGFASAANDRALAERGIASYTMPRQPRRIEERFADDEDFAPLHRRRSQTEARIGLFKDLFLRDRLPARSRAAQDRWAAWATLAHNLWHLARRAVVEQPEADEPAAVALVA